MIRPTDMDAGLNIDLLDILKFPEGGIFSRVLAKSDTYNYTLMCLSKGTEIDTHTSTKNGCVQVIKGSGVFRLFDQDIALRPGIFIFMPKDAPHSLVADEDLAILLCLSS